jgi:hypothetical protein
VSAGSSNVGFKNDIQGERPSDTNNRLNDIPLNKSVVLSRNTIDHPGTGHPGMDQTGHPSTADQSGDDTGEPTKGTREIWLGWTLYVKYLKGVCNEHDWDLICVKIGADHDSHHNCDDGNYIDDGIDMEEKFENVKNSSRVMANEVFIYSFFRIVFGVNIFPFFTFNLL